MENSDEGSPAVIMPALLLLLLLDEVDMRGLATMMILFLIDYYFCCLDDWVWCLFSWSDTKSSKILVIAIFHVSWSF